MKSDNSIKLNCFTPPVSLATFVIETAFAVYILARYRRDRFVYGVGAVLLCLGIFQLSEYMMCTGGDIWWWLRVGHVAITMLPPLGLHLVRMETNSRGRMSVWIAYALATAFSIAFFILPDALNAVTCAGKFVAFHSDGIVNRTYGLYYLGILFWGIVELFIGLKHKTGDSILMQWMIAGYASFLVPTAVVYVLVTQAHIGIASIMCGFAILLAMVLVFKIIPRHRELNLPH
ncbi:MAG: hypothetical protein Q8P11_00910 [bacterium]|nr:hypothetical protein [bacterium]